MLSVDTYRMDTLAASGIPHSRHWTKPINTSCVALYLSCPLCPPAICHWSCAVFTLRNSGTNKEGVGRTCMGLGGCVPIAGRAIEHVRRITLGLGARCVTFVVFE
ncbi:hypothetical protein [Sulfuriferula sp.]|uniref:hypothetical protein n=1 Tax=Sulfuriferula sp. TaxID=2025307 RepID=UPI002730BB60|nr:hypothetical protein [Sulfuriferula sp.]MDP2027068.1 hypothetical protein [Sulfuriferula sp.]